MKLKDLTEEKRKETRGTYAGVHYSPASIKAIQEYLKGNDIPNPIDPKKIHTTVLYSRKFLPNYKPQGKLEQPIKATFDKFVVWKTTPPDPKQVPWNCLVMKLKCPELVELHKKYMKEHEATYDYDEYTPHVTMSYNIGDLNVSDLPDFSDTLEVIEEYFEELNLDWANTHGTK